MTWGLVAVGAGTLIGGKLAGDSAAGAADRAAAAQTASAQAGIDETRRQFDTMRELLAPYVNAGNASLEAQQALLGLAGPQAQADAIRQLTTGSEYTALAAQGEDALLQNASATGGLRGGNVQGALAQFRPQLLSSLIQQRFQNLGGITALGQNAAAGTGNAGIASGSQIAQLLADQGSATAGAALAQGQAQANLYGTIPQLAGLFAKYKGVPGF